MSYLLLFLLIFVLFDDRNRVAMEGFYAVSYLYLDKSGERTCFSNSADSIGSFYGCVDFRSFCDLRLVRFVLVAEAAHESAAGARDLRRVEREILFLRHLDRHLNKVGEEA